MAFPYWGLGSIPEFSSCRTHLGSKRKLLFLVSEDWYFCSHRLHLARAVQKAGMKVHVVTRVNRHGAEIEAAGLHLIPFNIRRGGLGLFHDIPVFFSLIRIYRRLHPDIVHHVAMKPVLYGSLAAAICGVPYVVNAMAGMGFVFSSGSRKAAWIRPFIRIAFHRLLGMRRSYLIVQNPDDWEFFVNQVRIPESRTVLIPGSGVDTTHFFPAPFPRTLSVVITLVARMLEDKGVREFVDAIRCLKQDGLDIRAKLVGEEDVENPAHIPHHELMAWAEEGVVEWEGRQEDIPEVWAQSHIAVLPSYREGLPKSLLEAAACGRPIVATDVPGCREIVRHEFNGLLVAPGDVPSLASAIRRLAEDEQLRINMGRNGRKLVEQHFSNERVQEETLALYKRLLST